MSTQEQLNLFAQGLLARLQLWPAFQIALSISNRSDETSEQITFRLAEELLDAFITAPEGQIPEPSRMQEFLQEFIDVELEVLLEDDSDREVTRDLGRLWLACIDLGEGQEMVDSLVQLANKKKGHTVQATRIAGEDDGDTDESDSGSEEEGDEDAQGSMDVDETPSSRQPNKLEPIIDDDGFQTIQKSRRRHNK